MVIKNDHNGSSLIMLGDLGRQPEGWLYPILEEHHGHLRSCL
jgi:hypothetical protein